MLTEDYMTNVMDEMSQSFPDLDISVSHIDNGGEDYRYLLEISYPVIDNMKVTAEYYLMGREWNNGFSILAKSPVLKFSEGEMFCQTMSAFDELRDKVDYALSLVNQGRGYFDLMYLPKIQSLLTRKPRGKKSNGNS